MADGTGLNEAAHATSMAQPRSNKLPDRPLEITIHDLWRRMLGRPDIGVKETFADLGGQPAQAQRMLADVERIIRRPLPEGAWRQQLTIRNLSRAIALEAEKDGLVTCAAEGDGRPFFFCHGDYSTRGFYALDLADRIGGRTPVYLLHPAYEPGGQVSLDEMAKGYVDEILQLQPKGPVDVGGYCNGGTVAWAVAHQLAARGIEVNRLVLIDTMTLNARTTFRTVARMAGDDRRVKVMSELWWQATEYRPGPLMMAFHMVTLALGRKAPDVPQRTTRLARVEDAACYTLAPYMLPKARCHVDYVVATDSVSQPEFQARPLAKLAPSLTRHVVSGGHLTCITTHANSLAAVLRSVLEAPPPRKAAQRR